MQSLRFSTLLLGLSITGCSVAAKKPAVDTVMADDATRKQIIEAVLENLEKHPSYIDDVYRATRRHPVVLIRIEQDAAQDLKDPTFAASTVAVLAQTPEALESTTTASVAVVKNDPAARAAVIHAIAANPDGAIAIVAHDKGTMTALVASSAKLAQDDPKARAALVAAIQKDAPSLVAILVKDPSMLDALADPLFQAVEASPEAHHALVEAVDRASPRLVQLAAEDPKMLARLTESVVKASLHDKAALKQMLKRLLSD